MVTYIAARKAPTRAAPMVLSSVTAIARLIAATYVKVVIEKGDA